MSILGVEGGWSALTDNIIYLQVTIQISYFLNYSGTYIPMFSYFHFARAVFPVPPNTITLSLVGGVDAKNKSEKL